MNPAEDSALVERLHEALDRASDLAISLSLANNQLAETGREIAAAIVEIMDRAEANSRELPA